MRDDTKIADETQAMLCLSNQMEFDWTLYRWGAPSALSLSFTTPVQSVQMCFLLSNAMQSNHNKTTFGKHYQFY